MNFDLYTNRPKGERKTLPDTSSFYKHFKGHLRTWKHTLLQAILHLPLLDILSTISQLINSSFGSTLFLGSSGQGKVVMVKTLPFNRYSWLTTHNSFAMLGLGQSH
ncbi:unnamed protein product [Prunus brigantina]